MNKLMPLEFKNQRIMLTKVLADEFGTDDKIIQQNFKRNEGRFTKGKHYYRLTGDELKEFKANLHLEGNLKFASELILWTDRGAARHAKILDTDEAWDVYEVLEENYFNPKQTLNTSELSPELQMFNKMFQVLANNELEQKKMKEDIEETKEKLEGIKEVVALNSTDWKNDAKNLIVKIAHKLGGNQFIQDVYKEIYTNLERRAGCQLEIRLTNKRRRMAEEGICKSKRDKLNKLDIIGEEKKILECFLAIVKELAIKYGV